MISIRFKYYFGNGNTIAYCNLTIRNKTISETNNTKNYRYHNIDDITKKSNVYPFTDALTIILTEHYSFLILIMCLFLFFK